MSRPPSTSPKHQSNFAYGSTSGANGVVRDSFDIDMLSVESLRQGPAQGSSSSTGASMEKGKGRQTIVTDERYFLFPPFFLPCQHCHNQSPDQSISLHSNSCLQLACNQNLTLTLTLTLTLIPVLILTLILTLILNHVPYPNPNCVCALQIQQIEVFPDHTSSNGLRTPSSCH